MEIRSARSGQIIPYALLPMAPGVIELLDAVALGENIEMTGYFASAPLHHGVIDGIEVIAGVPDPSLPVLGSAESLLSALPPGSICEACWDQPATQVLPAEWGGGKGVCAWCAKGDRDEALQALSLSELDTLITQFDEAQTLALNDAVRRRGPHNAHYEYSLSAQFMFPFRLTVAV